MPSGATAAWSGWTRTRCLLTYYYVVLTYYLLTRTYYSTFIETLLRPARTKWAPCTFPRCALRTCCTNPVCAVQAGTAHRRRSELLYEAQFAKNFEQEVRANANANVTMFMSMSMPMC